MQEDQHIIKMQELLAIYVSMTPDEMEKTIEAANKKFFNNKH